jgi:hypothetical protein
MGRRILGVVGSLVALGAALPVAAQTSARSSKATASSDSAIYAAFFETLNREPRRDTIFVEEQSVVFQSISPHYDSVAPGLAARLIAMSAPARGAASLHLPPPVVVISATAPQAIRERALNGPPGQAATVAQGVRGVWQLSPIAYTQDGTGAMFYYRLVCGVDCGEETIVWARKNPKGKWEIQRTAILRVS